MDFIDSIDIEELLKIIPELLRDADTQVETASHLINRIVMANDTEQDVKRILRTMAGNLTPNSAITEQLLELLECYQNPILIIEALPEIVGSSIKEIQMVIEKYKQILTVDRSFLLPIIGSLSQLQLPEKMKTDVFLLTVSALNIVEEDDLPTVVRTLLHSMTKELAGDIIESIRKETRNLSSKALPMIVEVLSNALKISKLAVNRFFKAVSTSKLYKLDILLLLIMVNNPQVKISTNALNILMQGLIRQAADLSLLKSVIEEKDVLKEHQQALVTFCSTLLQSSNKVLISWASDLFLTLFLKYEASRAEVISNLLTSCVQCFQQAATGNNSKESNAARGSAAILLMLSRNYGNFVVVNAPLIEEVLMHPHSLAAIDAATNIVTDDFYFVLHALSESLVSLCAHRPTMSNSIMIYIQKQIFSGNIDAQRCGLILSSHVTSILSEQEKASLVQWVLRMIDSCAFHIRLFIFDMLVTNIHKFPQELKESIYYQHLLPLVSETHIVQYLEEVAVHRRKSKTSTNNKTKGQQGRVNLFVDNNNKRVPVFDIGQIIELSRKETFEGHNYDFNQLNYYTLIIDCFLAYHNEISNVLTSWDSLLMAGFRVPTNVKKHFKDFEETTDEMEEDNEDTYTEPRLIEAAICCYLGQCWSTIISNRYLMRRIDSFELNNQFMSKLSHVTTFKSVWNSILERLNNAKQEKSSIVQLLALLLKIAPQIEWDGLMTILRLLPQKLDWSSSAWDLNSLQLMQIKNDFLGKIYQQVIDSILLISTDGKAIKDTRYAISKRNLLSVKKAGSGQSFQPFFSSSHVNFELEATTSSLTQLNSNGADGLNGHTLLQSLHKFSFFPWFFKQTKSLLEQLDKGRKDISTLKSKGNEKYHEAENCWSEALKGLFLIYLILWRLFEYAQQFNGTVEEIINRSIDEKELKTITSGDLAREKRMFFYNTFAEQFDKLPSKFLSFVLVKLMFQVTKGTRKTKDVINLSYASLRQIFIANEKVLASYLPYLGMSKPSDELWIKVTLENLFDMLNRDPDTIISLISKLLNTIEDFLEEREGTDAHEHKTFTAISTSTIHSFMVLLSNQLIECISRFKVSKKDLLKNYRSSPFEPLKEFLQLFVQSMYILIDKLCAKKPVPILPWDFLFKLCVKLIPILNSRLEYCVSWRTQVEEYLNDEQNENTDIYSVDNLVPLIDSSLEIISVLKLSVKKVKQDASKKRKRGAVNDTLPRIIYHVEKFSEDVAEMISSHHIETTVNNKDLEKKIQQRLSGKKTGEE
jgi:hypothetical protein